MHCIIHFLAFVTVNAFVNPINHHITNIILKGTILENLLIKTLDCLDLRLRNDSAAATGPAICSLFGHQLGLARHQNVPCLEWISSYNVDSQFRKHMTIVAKFEIPYIQFLDKDGNVVHPLPAFAKNPRDLIPMYRNMNLVRILDNKSVNLQRMGKMGTYPSSLGQEAVGVGMASGMHQDDVLVPYYRDQGAMIVRGVKIVEILGYWGGDERSNYFSAPQVREDFPISVPVGTQNLHAAGVAFAIKYHKQNRAVVGGCGEGGTSKGDFYEAMNFAGIHHLPVVFVINNNQWAISVPRKLQTAAQTFAQKAIAAGISGVQVDGNDVIAVRFAVNEAVNKARKGEGATVIEAVTYRLCDHTTADNAKRYIDENELKQACAYDPIVRLRNYLTQQKAWTEADEKKLLTECTQEVDHAIAEYLNAAAPAPTDMLDYLYEQLPEELKEQREQLT